MKKGKYIIILLPDSFDCNIERFKTLKELEEAMEVYGCEKIACKEIEYKLIEEN